MSEHIDTVPELAAADPDSWRFRDTASEILGAQAMRINALNAAIWESPEAYLDAVSHFGSIALSEGDLPQTYTAAPIDVGMRIGAFLRNRDDVRIEYDEQSDEVIYADPEVRQRLAFQRSRLTVRHKAVGRDQFVAEDHPEAAAHRDQLSLYKLYLYIRRVRAYKAQTEHGDNNGQSAA